MQRPFPAFSVALLAFFGLAAAAPTFATTLDIASAVEAQLNDFPLDGSPDAVFSNNTSNTVALNPGVGESRMSFEFDLSTLPGAPNSIQSTVFTAQYATSATDGSCFGLSPCGGLQGMLVFEYPGNGTAELSDFGAGTQFLAVASPPVSPPGSLVFSTLSFNVTQLIRNRVSASDNYAGFTFRGDGSTGFINFEQPVEGTLSVTLLPDSTPGALDPTFGGDGLVTSPSAFRTGSGTAAIQSDGKIVAIGGFGNNFAVLRFLTDGSLDPSFAGDGSAQTSLPSFATATAGLIQSDGSIVAGGRSGSPFDSTLVRYLPNGSLDSSFGAGGIAVTDLAAGAGDGIEDLALQNDGKIVAAGRIISGNGDWIIARYHSNGSLDSGFGTGGIITLPPASIAPDRGIAVAVQADGKVVAVGTSQLGLGGQASITLARYETQGTLDLSFGTNGFVFTDLAPSERATDAVLQIDGKIVVVGSAFQSNEIGSDFAVLRYNPDGSLDSSFGGGSGIVTTDIAGNTFGQGSDEVRSVLLQSDGKIVAVGRAGDGAPANTNFGLARYNSDGTLDSSFGVGGIVTTDFAGDEDQAYGAALRADGTIVAVGRARVGGISGLIGVARYVGDGLNTEIGEDVVVEPIAVDGNGDPLGESPITFEFAEVTSGGETTVTVTQTGPPPPSGFKLGQPPTYFDLETSATFVGDVEVCIDYSEIGFGDEGNLRLLHEDSGAFVDVTTLLDTANDVICGVVSSFSFFLVAEADAASPLASLASASANPSPINTNILVTALIDDATTGESLITSASVSVDGGVPIAMVASDAAFDSPTEAVEALIVGFSEAGVHEICISGVDGAGNISSSDCLLLAVFDPSAGFVTGGGWIDSPPGAYTPENPNDPDILGKANFGFVSRYKKGAQVPEGQTEFRFNAANLNFHSTSYDWLVIAGTRAQYKGDGSINGIAGFKFMLTAIDDDTDRFRIKIWNAVTDEVVYDNKAGSSDTSDDATALGGGNIVIHKKN